METSSGNPLNTLLLAIALAAAVAGCSGKQANEGAESQTPSAVAQGSDPGNSHAKSTSPLVATRQADVHAGHADPASSRICTEDCRDAGPLVATSQQEAEWLVRHQYPSAAALDRLRALTLDALRQQASLGNPAASAVLGKRISLEKDFLEGQVILRNQALSGNYYAFYAMSESYREAQIPNLVDSAAYLRLAYILGDHKAAKEIARMNLSSIELAAADARASRLFKGFAGDQVPDPRPQE